MAAKTVNDEMMKRYLLGSLTEDEQIQVQERFLADQESFEQLKLIEDDLIDDYVQHKLARGDRRQFEMYYLVTPERRKKVEFAEDLRKVLTTGWRPDWLSFVHDKWQAFLNFLATPHPVLKWTYALGGIVLFVGGSMLLMTTMKLQGELEQLKTDRLALSAREQKLQEQVSQERDRSKQLTQHLEREKEQRLELQKQLANSPSSQSAMVSFVLAADLVRRESGEAKRLIIPKDVTFVRLQLILENAMEYKSYRVIVATAGDDEIWGEDMLLARKIVSGKAVIVRIPAQIFASDDYTITLFGIDAAGTLEEAGEYFFPVLKR